MPTKATPSSAPAAGPWIPGTKTERDANPGKSYVLKADPDGVYYEIADCHGNEANAHLIAAAPELLFLCKEFLEQDCCCCADAQIEEHSCLYCLIDKAVAKAEGRA